MKTVYSLEFFATIFFALSLSYSNLGALKQHLLRDKAIVDIINAKFPPKKIAEFYQYYRQSFPKKERKELPLLSYYEQLIESNIYTCLEIYTHTVNGRENDPLNILRHNLLLFFSLFNQEFYAENQNLFQSKIDPFIAMLRDNVSNPRKIMEKTVLFIKAMLYEAFCPDAKEDLDDIDQQKKYEKEQRTDAYFKNREKLIAQYQNLIYGADETPEDLY